MKVGDGFAEGVTVGPLISDAALAIIALRLRTLRTIGPCKIVSPQPPLRLRTLLTICRCRIVCAQIPRQTLLPFQRLARQF